MKFCLEVQVQLEQALTISPDCPGGIPLVKNKCLKNTPTSVWERNAVHSSRVPNEYTYLQCAICSLTFPCTMGSLTRGLGRINFPWSYPAQLVLKRRYSIQCILLVTGKSLRLFQGKGVFLRMTPKQGLCLLLLPFSKRHKCETCEPAQSIPHHVPSAARSCLHTRDGKMKEQL